MADISMGDEPSSIEKTVKLKGPMNGIAAIIIVLVVLIGFYFMTKKPEVATAPSAEPVVSTTNEVPSTPTTPPVPAGTTPPVAANPATPPTSTPPTTPSPVSQTPPATKEQVTPPTPPAPAVSAYKNGTYTATGNYESPAGSEQIGITLTLKGDVITAASAEAKATMPRSQRYQQMFADNFSAMVVGKNIDQVTLDKVSGSSLTPIGFNDALAKIKAQAKV